MSQHFRCFDEFGRYTGEVLDMGNPVNLNEVIIEKRYKKFQFSGQITHLISNATPNELMNMVSNPLFDRIKHMTQGVPFIGESKRK